MRRLIDAFQMEMQPNWLQFNSNRNESRPCPISWQRDCQFWRTSIDLLPSNLNGSERRAVIFDAGSSVATVVGVIQPARIKTKMNWADQWNIQTALNESIRIKYAAIHQITYLYVCLYYLTGFGCCISDVFLIDAAGFMGAFLSTAITADSVRFDSSEPAQITSISRPSKQERKMLLLLLLLLLLLFLLLLLLLLADSASGSCFSNAFNGRHFRLNPNWCAMKRTAGPYTVYYKNNKCLSLRCGNRFIPKIQCEQGRRKEKEGEKNLLGNV